MADVDLTYHIGTVSVAANGTVVTGTGGMLWTVSPNVRQWDVISIDGLPPVPIVASPSDNTHLTIPTWGGGIKTNVNYVIYQLSPLRFVSGQAMADVEKMLADLNTDGWYRYVNPAYADPTAQNIVANDGQYALKATTGEIWIMTGGVWVFVGTYGISVTNIRSVAGTADAILNTDNNAIIHYGNPAPVAVTIAQPTSLLFKKGWKVTIRNSDSGTVTITPTVATINGAASMKIAKDQVVEIWSSGANYFASLAFDPTAINRIFDDISIHGADIASAASINLETSTGPFVHITGSVGIGAVALADGHTRLVYHTGAPLYTAGGTFTLPNGVTTLQAEIGSFAEFIADGATVRMKKYSGGAVSYISAQILTALQKVQAQLNMGLREILTASRMYFVASTGNDANTGQRTATIGAITFTNGSSTVGMVAHGRSVGDVVVLNTTGGLPTNFAVDPYCYYVKTVVDVDHIVLAATAGGTAIVAGSAGTGTHTATLIQPFLTIQKAINNVFGLDINTQNLTIQVAGGTYTNVTVNGKFLGSGVVTLQGDNTTPSNCVINGASVDCVFVTNGGALSVLGFKLTSSGGGAGFSAFACASINIIGKMEYGAITGAQMRASLGASVTADGTTYTISGGAAFHMLASTSGTVSAQTCTVTVSGTPAFASAYALCTSAASIFAGGTITGAATGTRFSASNGGVINVGGLGLNFFPGNVAGSPTTLLAGGYG